MSRELKQRNIVVSTTVPKSIADKIDAMVTCETTRSEIVRDIIGTWAREQK